MATKVYFIACGFPPVGRGNSVTNACVANALADSFDVEVICRRPDGDLLLSYQEDASLVDELDPRLRVHRIAGARWWGLNEALYAVGLLPCYYLNWVWSAWRRRRDFAADGVLFAVHPVFSGVLLGIALKKCHGLPLLVDFRDDFAGGMTRGWRRLFYPLYRRLEGWVLRRADRVTVTTQTLKDWLIERHGLQEDRVGVVYNVVPEQAAAKAPERPAKKPGEALNILYAGAISAVQKPESILQAHALMEQSRPELKGRAQVEIYGPESPYFKLHMRDQFGPGRRFGGFVPRRDLMERMSACDIGFLALSAPTYAYALPTKLFEYIAAGIPVLASLPQGAARQLIESSQIGLVADPGDTAGLARQLARLVEDEALRRRCSLQATALQKRLRPRVQTDKWVRILQDMAGEDAPAAPPKKTNPIPHTLQEVKK